MPRVPFACRPVHRHRPATDLWTPRAPPTPGLQPSPACRTGPVSPGSWAAYPSPAEFRAPALRPTPPRTRDLEETAEARPHPRCRTQPASDPLPTRRSSPASPSPANENNGRSNTHNRLDVLGSHHSASVCPSDSSPAATTTARSARSSGSRHDVPVRVDHAPAHQRQYVVTQPRRPRRPVHRQLYAGPDQFLRTQRLAQGDQEALRGILHGPLEGLVHQRDDPLVRLLVHRGRQLRGGGEVVIESPRLTPARRQMLTSPASESLPFAISSAAARTRA